MSQEADQRLQASKRAAATQAAALVASGMKVGLGTGSTAALVIQELGRRVRDEELDIVGTPTSSSAAILARDNDIPVRSLDELGRLDVAIDGADEVDPKLNLIKGRGGAHTREKVVASRADRFVVVVDESKLVDQLGSRMPVPVEILPMAAGSVLSDIEQLGGRPEIREAAKKDGPVVTDQGFWIIDARFETIDKPQELASALKRIVGVLDHGLFVDLTTDVFVGLSDGSVRRLP